VHWRKYRDFHDCEHCSVRPLDFPQQEQLIYAGEGLPKLGYPEISFACPDYLFVASHNRSFQSTAVYQQDHELSGSPETEKQRRSYSR